MFRTEYQYFQPSRYRLWLHAKKLLVKVPSYCVGGLHQSDQLPDMNCNVYVWDKKEREPENEVAVCYAVQGGSTF